MSKLLELAERLENSADPFISHKVAAILRAIASEQGVAVAGEWEWHPVAKTLYSSDFTHDASLPLNGDFASDAESNAYGLALCAKLNAHPPEAARDAVRYRWLRENFRFANDSHHEIWFDCNIVPTDPTDSAYLDATIDAAMKDAP